MGEEGPDTVILEAKDKYRIDTYYMLLNFVVSERENDLEFLCGVSDVILSPTPKEESYETVASHYNIDKDLLIVEYNLFFSFIDSRDISLDRPGDVLHIVRK